MAIIIALIGALLLVATVLLLVPVVVLFVQVLAARRSTPTSALVDEPSLRVAVVMPAHNEAGGIAASVKSVVSQLRAGDRLIVVADNCDDDTAAVAAAHGAEVTERTDALRRGKGYALDHGMRYLEAAPADVVVIVDADCVLGPDSLRRLACEAARSGRPVQALYLMEAPRGAGPRARIAQFAWVVRNQVRPLGFHRLNLPCQLMGTGMAFPWALIAKASLASGHLVEDMQLGLDLASAGTPPTFCPEAQVTSVFPEGTAATDAQRTRWEHGHLAMIATRGLPLLCRAVVGGRFRVTAMALDLCVPPLASLVLMLVAATLCCGVLWLAGGGVAPLSVAGAALMLTAVAAGIAWARFARHIVTFAELLAVPGYVLGKIPIYIKLFTARQMEWIRTKRDDDQK